MKITCNRERLLHAFQVVAAVAPSRSPKPILQNVKLEAPAPGSGLGATLTATDLEVSLRHAVEGVDTDAPGAVVLPVTRFGAILRECSDNLFRIETDGSKTHIRGERSTFQLPSENPAEFPEAPAFGDGPCFQAPARLLKEMIRRTAFATDNESSRYALGGVKFEASGEGPQRTLIAVGTDGRRLAKMEGNVEAVGEPSPLGDATIIPTRGLQMIDRVLWDDSATVRFAVRQNEALVATPNATLATRLLEGRFPRWRDVFPQRTDGTRIDLTVGPFYSSVRQAMIATSDESRGVDFTFGGGSLVLAGHAAEIGESRIEMPISFDGQPIEITLDPRFLVDFLKALDPEKAFSLELVDSDAAAVGRTDDGYGYVIMPLARDRK